MPTGRKGGREGLSGKFTQHFSESLVEKTTEGENTKPQHFQGTRLISRKEAESIQAWHLKEVNNIAQL